MRLHWLVFFGLPLVFNAIVNGSESSSGMPDRLEVSVPSGGDVQAAIDDATAKGGGTVTLASGVYPLQQTLWMNSDVCLAGQGRSTVLQGTTASRVLGIGTKRKTLKNVTIRDLALIGPAKREQMLTLPEGHPGKGPTGIFMNFETGKGQAIRLERLYVTLWEGMGVHLKGVDDLSISDCRFECTSAFNSLYHNVYLRRVRDVDIANNIFCDSPVGNGLQVSFSSHVRIIDNRSEGNAGHGIRVAASDNVTLTRNTVLHNRGGAGIWLNCEKGTSCAQIDADNNLVRHNTNAGIAIQNTVHARFSENTALDNGTDFTFRNARDVTLRKNQFRTQAETKNNSVTFDQDGASAN